MTGMLVVVGMGRPYSWTVYVTRSWSPDWTVRGRGTGRRPEQAGGAALGDVRDDEDPLDGLRDPDEAGEVEDDGRGVGDRLAGGRALGPGAAVRARPETV
jgi:hypothetical protein